MVGGGGDLKVATVDVESVDNMATLPVSKVSSTRGGGGDGTEGGGTGTIEKNNAANKEAEAKKHRAQIKQLPHRTSQFIFLSFIYAKLLIVMCIAYVLSEVITLKLPVECYEGFFTYLYGVSIFFLLYVFCFLLQESSCCQGNSDRKSSKKDKAKEKKAKEKEKADRKAKEKEEKAKEKEHEKEKKKEEKEKKKDKKKEKEAKDGGAGDAQTHAAGKDKGTTGSGPDIPQPNKKQSNLFQGVVTTAMKKEKGLETPSQDSVQVYEPSPPIVANFGRKRKTTHSSQSHGSFFLRVGAIAFGLGTMIYSGLEFGVFFETPFNSPCYQILKGINPVLQMIFTFMQMYFIFMNSRLNIHRFKVVARFGLMHIVATNLCVWIRTTVLESIKEYDLYTSRHNLSGIPTIPPITNGTKQNLTSEFALYGGGNRINQIKRAPVTFAPAGHLKTTTKIFSSTMSKILSHVSTTPTTPSVELTTNRPTTPFTFSSSVSTASAAVTLPSSIPTIPHLIKTLNASTTAHISTANSGIPSTAPAFFKLWNNENQTFTQNVSSLHNLSAAPTIWDQPVAEALVMLNGTYIDPKKCGRINIMGNIVRDSAPFLYPFIVEYCLVGAAVIYIMWKHIGRLPKYSEEDLEHRLEAMLSRRAIAIAQATTGRMDCVGASKGLFIGLLLLVGSLICLILFFVLIHHPQLGLLAVYLADVSHCIVMVLSILAIFIGFWRVRRLKYYYDEGNSLNDLLQRVSAFGIFIYAMFSVIAGSLTFMSSEPNLLVMITGSITVLQVLCQVVFISDVSRRRVHLPEHDANKPGRQIVTFLLICNITMWVIYTFDAQKVTANPVQLNFYGFLAWSMIQRITLPLSIFYRFHAAVTLAEVWKTSYKPRLD
ncbi:proton channel OtopLc isoform X2 [Bemisia tabaci]|uniref:proton channel OtopLc isoform X2 n=1 Tax=Bemisia tabaci TaxID=7038 RepID=UPI0008F9A324|nr:PREDICTED: uncharacterized protein LOC109031994 isoform X2 [Bemisia tabaci]XP_018899411.1 PREDICTED: uncharacterized protein LOC109031994 isoform X2 [Bemisia tabaci]